MEKFSFSLVSPTQIISNPEAVRFLEMGAADFGGIRSVTNITQNAVSGRDLFVEVKNERKLLGAIYLTITQQEVGRVLTSVLLGAVEFDQWASELRQFYYKLARDYDCDEFCLMGRRGFKRYFSELQEVATIFRVKLKRNSNEQTRQNI